MLDTPEVNRDQAETAAAPNWALDAPRGGKTVMNRILKENATVPLFFAQTLIASLRDVGYNNTTSALCEHVDNAIEAGANEIRIYFRQRGMRGSYEIDAAVYDNGQGMSPNVLKMATAFGGSMRYGNREGIGRFGMGMKTAALSMSPMMELYSWQEKGAFYKMTLDVDDIGKDRANSVELPDPIFSTDLPSEVAGLFTETMVFPDKNEQDFLASPGDDLNEVLGASGTIVFLPNCDRLSYAKAQTLVDHAVKEMGRVYRRLLGNGVALYVNNRKVEIFDPTYWMPNARHTRIPDLSATQSRLIDTKEVDVPVSEASKETAKVTVKLYALPFETWLSLPRKIQKNDLRVFDGMTVSIVRNDREVYAGPMREIVPKHSVANWYRVQIDFPGVLDEAFGVAANKQGVRLKGYVVEAINKKIRDDVSAIAEEIKRFQSKQAAAKLEAGRSEAESKASDADGFQMKPLNVESLSPEEEKQRDDNLRGLSLTLKRDGETDEQAFERVKSSKYLITFKYDEYWPFYHVENRFGRVIMTINTAHPFFSKLYEPLKKANLVSAAEEPGEAGEPPTTAEGVDGLVVALDLLLLSLARTQSVLSHNNEDARKLLDGFRKEWSDAYRVQMTD
ncbi:ATP-binding protein [Bradyrhizobium sp.]|uniref:ATP-binding protein n=1 Tax=Bradyrhizobium sp. TaxID=376 RepID=UPI002DFA1D71|nr:ATP-binding protein [Bradyrhizobium sp.]